MNKKVCKNWRNYIPKKTENSFLNFFKDFSKTINLKLKKRLKERENKFYALLKNQGKILSHLYSKVDEYLSIENEKMTYSKLTDDESSSSVHFLTFIST